MRFFIKDDLNINKDLILSDDIYHHWIKVLRANIGDKAILFNGQGGEYGATITNIHKKSATVFIDNFNPINRTSPYQMTLIQAISKGERMDYTIQKATELGVSTIQLIVTERSERLRYERDSKKLTHWEKISVSACEQCGMNIIPKIMPPITLHECLSACTDDLKIVMSLPHDGYTFIPQNPLPSTISLLVGAEGGLSDDELVLCHKHGFISWAIGERILRTETAGVVGLAALQALGTLDTHHQK